MTELRREILISKLRRLAGNADINNQAYVNGLPYEEIREIADMLAAPTDEASLIEQCAKVADGEAKREIFEDPRGFCRATARAIAANIRKLGNKP